MRMNFSRVVIQGMEPWPSPEGYPLRSFEGRRRRFAAELFSPEGEVVAGRILFHRIGDENWQEVPLAPLGGDRFGAAVSWPGPGLYELTIEAWIDRVGSWKARFAAATPERQAEMLAALAQLAAEAAAQAAGDDREQLGEFAAFLESDESLRLKGALAQDPELEALLRRYVPAEGRVRVAPSARILVCSQRVAESAWVAPEPPAGETPAAWRELLSWWRRLSFTGVLLPAGQPPANSPGVAREESARSEAVGSVGAAGVAEGGNTEVRPEIGSWDDWDALVEAAREHGLGLSVELPLACSPQHSWLREHPDWFLRRRDGAVVAEGDPTRPGQAALRYDFCGAGEALVAELARVVRSWIDRGVETFHFTTPEKSPAGFWDALLEELRREHSAVEFCAAWEAPPNRRRRLAAAGFQWVRETAPAPWDREGWMAADSDEDQALPFRLLPLGPTEGDAADPALRRLWLALAAAFLPVFSVPAGWLPETAPVEGSEAAGDSGTDPGDWLPRLLDLRRREPAFWAGSGMTELEADSAALLAVLRTPPPDVEDAGAFVVVVNLDPERSREGWIVLPEELGDPGATPWRVREEMSGTELLWFEKVQEVRIDPERSPLLVFRLPDSHEGK
ncbi:MAG: hypothetical protein Kow00109_14110 [Acidobacteriota bacterium]